MCVQKKPGVDQGGYAGELARFGLNLVCSSIGGVVIFCFLIGVFHDAVFLIEVIGRIMTLPVLQHEARD